MNRPEILTRGELGEPRPVTRHQPRRSAPRAIKILLPVWGYNYVRQFLKCCLPTLLAPGNVPALAAALPTEFVLLTSADDAAFIQEHPTFKRLTGICEAKVKSIDHLITDGNYSTTITLAYTEAVREVGEAMLDTCFFFLVSDYVVADGSLANALERMQSGTSAIVVGNFQVARENALPWLQDRLTTTKHTLALPPRELMRWALQHLHPATLANIVNIPFSHNSHTNRLFWRVDNSTIIGRFYLMHMLCVRPEVTDFVIGASCDYSFVPEMCPSGDVEAIADSDEYLVIELQPLEHESRFLRPGAVKLRALAKSLSEWTTSVHRENARHTVIFHASDIPVQLSSKIAEADAFVAEVAQLLRRKPRPYRGHPYWRGAVAAYHDAIGQKLNESDWKYALGFSGSDSWLTTWMLYRARRTVMGAPPYVLPWHPSWPDFKVVLRELATFLTDRNQRLLMLSNEPTAFSLALADNGECVHRMRCVPFLKRASECYLPLHGKFDLCLLELPEVDLRYADKLVDRIVPLLKRNGRIIIFVRNKRVNDGGGEFAQVVTFAGAGLIVSGVVPTAIHFIPMNRIRRRVRRGMASLSAVLSRGAWLSVPLAVIRTALLFGISVIGNVDALRGTHRLRAGREYSSLVMRLNVDAAESYDEYKSTISLAPTKKATSIGSEDYESVTTQTRELQYNRCVDLKNSMSLTSLGLMTNQVWYDDPRRLTFLLSRYKFVAKMLSGCRNVGEIGCGDAFGTRIVLQEIKDVTVYDFDPVFIEDIRARQDERWPLRAEVHDIVAGPLPRKHEALFSLDVLEHIGAEDEHAYLANICASLADDGLLMIGTPSLESQPFASPPSKAGHVNCKSGNELKALLEKYFAHVFMFSMNDEVVHTGFSRMAHYLFALCTAPRLELGVVKRRQSPEFKICELDDASGFYVRVTYPNTEPQRFEGFATVGDAARWIGNQSLDWIRVDRPRHTEPV
jgi:hypothetical protein